MAAAFDSLQRAGFGGIAFPVRDIRVVGGLRDHVHEFPHSPGGAPEKLGRKLYDVHFSAPFLNTFKAYPDLWPESLSDLRDLFEAQTTANLIIPTIGTIKAYCYAWEERTELPSNRSGVLVDLSFREDQADEFLTDSLITVAAGNVEGNTADLLAAMQADAFLTGLSKGQQDLFAAIQATANSITAIADTADAYANLVQAKAAGLASLCAQADATVAKLNNPAHFRVLEALLGVWSQATLLERDALKLARPRIPFTTPTTMSVSQISTAIYGDTSQASQIMQLNAFDNPFSVRAGTAVLAYALPASF